MNDIARKLRENTYTAVEVAEILNIHRVTVRALVDRGELEMVVTGGGPRGRRITKASVDAYLKRLEDALRAATGA